MTNHTTFAALERHPVRRVILVVLDGLRPDAIERFEMARLAELVRRGAATLAGTTVAPSVTPACMASLFTGVSPGRHGVTTFSARIGRPRETLHPLPKLLRGRVSRSEAFMARVPWMMGGIARQIANALHVSATFAGRDSTEILDAALPRVRDKAEGLLILHWPDADDAGHAGGWMSGAYAIAARRLDAALGALMDAARIFDRDDTLLVVLADHGGGGTDPHDHESAHPYDRTIPIIFGGGAVAPRKLGPSVSLLDVPPTILWTLGVPVPASYEGRPLTMLFDRDAAAA